MNPTVDTGPKANCVRTAAPCVQSGLRPAIRLVVHDYLLSSSSRSPRPALGSILRAAAPGRHEPAPVRESAQFVPIDTGWSTR